MQVATYPKLYLLHVFFFIPTAVTDFSFVSSNVGIPFATNVNALTVTRCESADRYVEQLFSI